jgi:hypothetical protein
MKNKSSQSKGWVLVIGILMICALAGLAALYLLNTSIQKVPGNVVDSISSQAADMLKLTPTIRPNPATIIRNIQQLARLETIQYTVEKVVTAESGQGPFGFLFGDKLLLVAHGTIIAGVDLGKLTEGDLWITEDALYLHLPNPEIFTATLDNEKTYVYDRDTGILTGGSYTLETEARKAAQDEILNAALEDGILAQARTNAENFLLRLFWDLGFQNVIFVSTTPTP